MNRVLKILILSDLFFWMGMGFIGPIFAIYINNNIKDSTIGLVGVSMAVIWIMKSVTALVTSRFTDHENGNELKLKTLVIGYIISFVSPFGFIFANSIWDIIFVQILFGFGIGLAYPGWMTIFSRFLESGKEGMTWSLDETSISLGNSLAIGLSGFIVEFFGFYFLFGMTILFNFLSLVCILILFFRHREEILSRRNKLKYFMNVFFGI